MTEQKKDDELLLGNITISTPETKIEKLAMLLWGEAGCGKTTLAATAPGKKLWINFDPKGPNSLAGRDDVLIADYADKRYAELIPIFQQDGLPSFTRFVEEQKVDTIVVDSVTMFNEKALEYAVLASGLRGVSLENPTKAGYGRRNIYTMQMINNLNQLAMKKNLHIIFVTHEKLIEKTDAKGNALPSEVTMMLGGSLKSVVPIRISEVWNVVDSSAGGKDIHIVGSAIRHPMKTRMFLTNGPSRFSWKYDPVKWEGEGISDWYQRWVDNGGKKIELP